MSTDSTTGTTDRARRHVRVSHLVSRVLIELAIGVGIAALLVAVAWASSNAIRFVYGGY